MLGAWWAPAKRRRQHAMAGRGDAPSPSPILAPSPTLLHALRRGWLEFLADMRRQAGMIALVTCPLERMKGPLRAGARDVAGRRNEYLRQMVAAEWGGSIGSSPGPGGSGGSDSSGGGGGGGGGEPAPDPAVGEEDGDSDGAADGSGGFSGPLGEDMEAAAAPAAAPQPEPLQQAGPEQQRQPDQLQQQQQQRAARAGAGLAPLVLIDIDAMTRRLPQEVTLPPMDHHYQCYLSSASKYQSEYLCPGHAGVALFCVWGGRMAGGQVGAGLGACAAGRRLAEVWVRRLHLPFNDAACSHSPHPQTARCCGQAATGRRRRGTRRAASTSWCWPPRAPALTPWTMPPGSCSFPCCARSDGHARMAVAEVGRAGARGRGM